MAFEPLVGRRHIQVTPQHIQLVFARCMKWYMDEVYSTAEVIRVVLDNLPAHKPGTLYETFPPEEPRQILKNLEFHFTPKHASWLNMAEIELSIFRRTIKNLIPEQQAFSEKAIIDERAQ
jgi:hypothetical protein